MRHFIVDSNATRRGKFTSNVVTFDGVQFVCFEVDPAALTFFINKNHAFVFKTLFGNQMSGIKAK